MTTASVPKRSAPVFELQCHRMLALPAPRTGFDNDIGHPWQQDARYGSP